MRLSIDETGARQAKKDVEVSSASVLKIVDQLVKKYCRDLDTVVKEVEDLLRNKEELLVEDLRYYISYLPTQLYFANNALEDLGVEGDVAKAIRAEAFNEAYLNSVEGTVKAKTSDAQKLVVNEQLIEDVFVRAYKKAKARIDHALTLHSALKKILQWKITELEVTGYHSN